MEAASHRACDNCRSLKTRCLLNETSPDVCERCVRFGRQCIFTPLQRRRRRKRTDTRVTELEREMSALLALLQPDNEASKMTAISGNFGAQSQQASWNRSLEKIRDATSQANNILTQAPTVRPGWSKQGDSSSQDGSLLDRGLLSMETAHHLVEQYKNEMYPHYPIVYIPSVCTADELHRTKPMLFLAIIAAASGKEYPEMAIKLDQAVLEEYANRTVLGSEKSLELVQSLLVSSTWYQPPTRLNQYKYTEYVHMAGMMAIDIGISSRHLDEDNCTDSGTASDDSRRTFLAILVKGAGTTITSRKPPTTRINSYAKECLNYLEQYSQVPGDGILVWWTRLLIIADEIGRAFAFDDPGEVSSILDIKTQLMISAFKKRLGDWRVDCPSFNASLILQVTYYTVRLYLNEIALYIDHRPEDFKVPYRMSFMIPYNDQPIPVKPVVEALAELLENAHALLDAFLSVDASIARALPLGMFVRVSYAAFILAKLCISAAQEQSQLAALIDRNSLNAESYMNRTLLHIRSAIGTNGCRLPAIFLNLIFQMRVWCIHPELHKRANGGVRLAYSQPPLTVTASVEDASCSSSSPDMFCHRANGGSAALTGTFEANYESFGNDQAVKSAAFHGLQDQTVGISSTLAQLDSALRNDVRPTVDVSVGQSSGPAEPSPMVEHVALSHDNGNHDSVYMDDGWHDGNALFMLDCIDNFLAEDIVS